MLNAAYKVKFFYVVFAFSIAIVLLSSVTISVVIYYRLNAAIVKQNDDFIRNTTAQLKRSVLSLIRRCSLGRGGGTTIGL